MSESKIDQYDSWLQDNGPAALVFHRLLLPVEGKEAWIFPPTFAAWMIRSCFTGLNPRLP